MHRGDDSASNIGGSAFPLARLVAVFDLGRGALTTLGVGRYQGKATGEMALFQQQQSH